MNLNNLEEVNFVEDDTEVVKQNVITTYEGITGRSLAPADPERLFLEGLAAIIGQQKVLINQTGRQNLLAYAEKQNLDHLGALVETERLPEQPSKTTVRFYMKDLIIGDLNGIRVTPDGKLFFKAGDGLTTKEFPFVTESEDTYVDIPVTCETQGVIGNGYLPGQIKKLVDPVSSVNKIENITTSSGGADIESDDSYRLRINNAPSRFSTAGPKAAYEYFVKSTHQDIVDVSVTTPAIDSGKVNICFLLSDGKIPADEDISNVEAIVNSDTVRPLTDQVIVDKPTISDYNVELEYILKEADRENEATIDKKIKEAVEEYILWQKSKLGRDINPDYLFQKVIAAGAKRVTITQPKFTILELNQVGIINEGSDAKKINIGEYQYE
ncbi:MAG: baseplate J/gp47 family protein [Desulfobacterales bacterium]|nr:baseplate J/gp47 family protein [Desulfobacterales bacterium]